jgi:hypothetical protein
MRQVAAAQRQGLVDKAAGWAEKAKLRREILDRPIAHLAEVGKRAGRRVTDLGLAFRYRQGSQSYEGFRTAARAMQATAEAKKEVLMKFGLSGAVLGQFGELSSTRRPSSATAGGPRTRGPRSSSTSWRRSWPRWSGRWTRGTGAGSGTTGGCWSRGSAPARSSGFGGGRVSPSSRGQRGRRRRVGRRERAAK